MKNVKERTEVRDAKGLTEAEFLAHYNADKYPKPSLTADIVIFKTIEGQKDPEVLLIRRKGHPYLGFYALPGGFSEPGESIEDSAARELEEETGVKGMKLSLSGVYSKPGRDPRGWTVSAAFTTVVKAEEIEPKAGDDAAEVLWARVSRSATCHVYDGDKCIDEELAFDHLDIIRDAKEHII